MISQYLKLSFASLRHRKLRSWLTIIGIVIGIAAIISLISLGEGLENAITEQFQKLGTNSIRVVPKGLRGSPAGLDVLNQEDADAIEKIAGVEYSTPIILERAKVRYGKEDKYAYIVSFPSENVKARFADTDVKLEQGRVFVKGEKGVAIAGYDTAYDTFDKDVRLRSSIYINGRKFKVIGIFKYQGNQQVDKGIYIPLEEGRELFNKPSAVSVIMVRVEEGRDLDVVAKTIKRKLDRMKDEETYEVFTPKQLLGQLFSILNIVQFILAGIAAISLAVGGIGIMNSMYTSVLQRTRDIGVMKAIGATNNDILAIFLTESGLMGLAGGLLGAIAGVSLAFAVEGIARQLGYALLSVRINWYLILFSLLFAFLVGVASGLLPAMRAAKMEPAESLRYE